MSQLLILAAILAFECWIIYGLMPGNETKEDG